MAAWVACRGGPWQVKRHTITPDETGSSSSPPNRLRRGQGPLSSPHPRVQSCGRIPLVPCPSPCLSPLFPHTLGEQGRRREKSIGQCPQRGRLARPGNTNRQNQKRRRCIGMRDAASFTRPRIRKKRLQDAAVEAGARL